MRGRTVRTPEKEEEFLEALSDCGNVTRACELTEISRRSAYDWREADSNFAAKWDAAQKLGTAALEDEAHRRAYEGTLEPVFFQGRQCGEVRKFSDTLMIVLLKARDPDRFKDRMASEHSGPGGGPVQIQAVRRTIVDPKNEDENKD